MIQYQIHLLRREILHTQRKYDGITAYVCSVSMAVSMRKDNEIYHFLYCVVCVRTTVLIGIVCRMLTRI